MNSKHYEYSDNLNWKTFLNNPNALLQVTKKYVNQSNNTFNKIQNFTFNKNSELKFLSLLADDAFAYGALTSMCIFLQYKATNDITKKCIYACHKMILDHIYRIDTKKPIYLKIKAFKKKYKDTLSDSDKYFLNKILKNYTKNGIHLPFNKQSILNHQKKQINKIRDHIFKIIHRQKKLTKIKCEKNRKNIDTHNGTLSEEIITQFNNFICVNTDIAQTLSYGSLSNMTSELTMAKNFNKISEFLLNYSSCLSSRYIEEFNILYDMKKNHIESKNKKFDGSLNIWDIDFYKAKFGKQLTHDELFASHFKLNHVIETLMLFFNNLLNINFVFIGDADENIQLYQVYRDDDILGNVYFDLQNKTKKTVEIFIIQQPSVYPLLKKKTQLGEIFLCGYYNSYDQGLTYLQFKQLVHKFSQLVINLLNKTKYNSEHISVIQKDFAGIPALTLTNLIMDPNMLHKISNTLSKISSNKNDVNYEAISIDVFKNIDYERNRFMAINNKIHIIQSLFDFAIFSSNDHVDITKICSESDIVESVNLFTGIYGGISDEILNYKKKYKINKNNDIILYTNTIANVIKNPSMYHINLSTKYYADFLFLLIHYKKLSLDDFMNCFVYSTNRDNIIQNIENIIGFTLEPYDFTKLYNIYRPLQKNTEDLLDTQTSNSVMQYSAVATDINEIIFDDITLISDKKNNKPDIPKILNKDSQPNYFEEIPCSSTFVSETTDTILK